MNEIENDAALEPASFLATRPDTVHLGVDLGTNSSVLTASAAGEPFAIQKDLVTTVVGFPKPGIIPGILPSDAEVLFGDEALNYRLHLDLSWPLKEGFVDDVETSRLFAAHLRSLIDVTEGTRLVGVVGAPANASDEKQKVIRSVMARLLDRLLIVPEPFLAAMGLRDDPSFVRLGAQSDPTKHSLIVDIGAGTTDLCLVRGYFPTADDLVSANKAGDFIDELIWRGIQRRYPDLCLTKVTVRKLKEQHSFVGDAAQDASVKVYVDGRPRMVDLSAIVREACEELLPIIVGGIKELLARCDSDSCVDVMHNIIITGGGSQIRGLPERIEELLREDDYDCARTITPADYKHLVARGALRIAENVREDQWQIPM